MSTSAKSQLRPPVVTIMGHVDHGKTTLLDYIRKTKVVDKEHGGITQHMGAYQVSVGEGPHKRLITFIDTPGHAAFSQMRSRGGQVADLAILVVAANDGVKPQTKESLEHITRAGIPFIVAINKMDLPAANPDLVKSKLAELGHMTEDLGGNVMALPVSALTGDGIEDLLEAIALLAEEQQITADPTATLEAIVIESQMDSSRGPIATVVIKNGQLKVKSQLHAENVDGKVKAMFDDTGKSVTQALPGQPVQILGFASVPPVGAQVHTGTTSDLPVQAATTTLTTPAPQAIDTTHVKIILKTDVAGSAEAINHSLPEGVQLLVSEAGSISEGDIMLAKTTQSVVIGFNVKASLAIDRLAETEGVKVRTFTIIYELLEYLEDLVKRVIDPMYGKEEVGRAEILVDFVINKRRIAGSRMLSGTIPVKIDVDIFRDEQIVGSSKLAGLRQGKQEVDRVSGTQEFGCIFSPHVDFRIGDAIVAYTWKK